MQTISEKFGFRSGNDLYKFLKDICYVFKEEGGMEFLCPSGTAYRVDEFELGCIERRKEYWFLLAQHFPFSEKLPTLDGMYDWVLEKRIRNERIADYLRDLDELYAVFSDSRVTGIEQNPEE